MRDIRSRLLPSIIILSVILAAVGTAFGQAEETFFGGFSMGSGEPKVTATAEFTAASADAPARLFVTATMESGWHIYSTTQPSGGPIASKIRLAASEAYRVVGEFKPSKPPEKKDEPAFGNLTVESHHDAVTWYAPIELAPGVNPAELAIAGSLFAQPCDSDACLPPQNFAFTAKLGAGVNVPDEQPGTTPDAAVTPSAVDRAAAPPTASPPHEAGGEGLPWQPFTDIESFGSLLDGSKVAFDPAKVKANVQRELGKSSLFRELVLAFLGGIVLNLMPCVLPVIGLKILSFVEQSGHDRRRALFLNVWYSLGLMSVFMVLASLAVFLGFGWGHLFKFAGFSVALAAVVFAMGLSFLGVWEIPIPGFVGGGKATGIAQKEGFAGAFSKGVLTTILATPCTGPFMASALAWAVSQSAVKTYAVFGAVGLGMASPYLLIGAFPNLIRFLPKPGAWMDTFKQIMGFVLLGTVVYIFTFMEWPYMVPTLALLFAVWAACWWIARTPLTSNFGAKAWAWLEGTALVGFFWILLFPGISPVFSGSSQQGGLLGVMESRFDLKVKREAVAQQIGAPSRAVASPSRTDQGGPRTVLIDFTADWCLTCKTLEATVLNTAAVSQFVEQNGVVTLQADWTHTAPEVTRFLDVLGGRQVPVVAIFSPNAPNNPIIFRGAYTQQTLLDALIEAGPSQ